MYEFSAPLPTRIEEIDEIIELNKRYSQSKIKTFYFALPINASDRTTFEQVRTENQEINNFESIEKYISYAIDNNFEFIYLLNSISGFSNDATTFKNQCNSLDNLLSKLTRLNCNKLRITNFQLVSYILKNHPDFEIYVSTSTEYTQIRQFQNMLKLFPSIKEIIPSFEVNKNFHLLKTLKKQLKTTEVELIADEGCITGCPFRTQHPLMFSYGFEKPQTLIPEDNEYYSVNKLCYKLSLDNYNEYLCKTNVIFPWDIKHYGKIGYRKFKFVGRNIPYHQHKTKVYDYYFRGIEDPSSINNIPINRLIYRYRYTQLPIPQYLIKDIRPHLPSIKYFIKNGKDCHYKCGTDCTYCSDKAKKISKIMNTR